MTSRHTRAATRTWRPSASSSLRLPRGVYLVDVGDEHLQRVFGWYYGYDDEDGDFDWEDWEG